MHWCSLGHGSIPSIRHKRLSIGEEGGPGTRLSTNFLSFLPIISVQVFFPQRGLPLNSVHTCISFGFLVLTQTTRQESTPGPVKNQVFDFLFVFLRVCEYHICVFACLWILHLCFACLWIWDLCICVCKIIIFVYLPSTTSPSKARQPCRRPLHVQGRTGCIKSILGSKGATKPMAWVAFSTRFISKGLGGQVFRRLEHKRGDLVLW